MRQTITAVLITVFLFFFSLVSWAAEPPAAASTTSDIVVDEVSAPEVTIKQRGQNTVREYRIKGKLYMVKVTPAHGTPYYLIDDRGDGIMRRMESMDSGLSVPMWVVKQF